MAVHSPRLQEEVLGEPAMTTMTNRRTYRKLALSKGERSSAGRASVCGTEGRGFKSHRSPQTFLIVNYVASLLIWTTVVQNIRNFLDRAALRIPDNVGINSQSHAGILVSELLLRDRHGRTRFNEQTGVRDGTLSSHNAEY